MKKTYFASDFHLGIDTDHTSKQREQYIVAWLDEIKKDAQTLYLVGDILDYWFEYKMTVPKGFTRLFGKLAELSDAGIQIKWYTGNHDMWDFGYFKNELGIEVHKSYQIKVINGKTCFIGHGDGLGSGDPKYKMIKTILTNPLCQFLFSILPSRIGMGLMKGSSKTSRYSQKEDAEKLELKESRLFGFFHEILAKQKVDYFIYGHLHSGTQTSSSDQKAQFINLGDWTSLFTYGVMSTDGNFEMKKWRILS